MRPMRTVLGNVPRTRHATRSARFPPQSLYPPEQPPHMPRRIVASPFVVACVAAIALGCAIRARPVLLTDFPLNDGGLFFQMTEELQRAHYRLPTFTAYNAVQIPFAYAPFGFYVAGLISDVLSVDLMQVIRLLPLATTCATLVAFLLLARSMLPERTAIVAAVASFALVPRS